MEFCTSKPTQAIFGVGILGMGFGHFLGLKFVSDAVIVFQGWGFVRHTQNVYI